MFTRLDVWVKITENKKAEDGRVLITLTGISRFEIKTEINNDKSYREFEISYDKFKQDLDHKKEQLKKIEQIRNYQKKLIFFFKKKRLYCSIGKN